MGGKARRCGGSSRSPGGGLTLTAVIAGGLLDGLNPCAFSVLLSFVAVILAGVALTQDPRPFLWKAGGTYVAGMFLTYLLLGLGLITAVSPFTTTHLPVRLMGFAVVVLGLFTAGALVGLCTLPCSGAIYLGVLALIAREPLAVRLPYLVLHNVLFVAPLLVLLAVVSHRRVLNRVAHAYLRQKGLVKGVVGVVTVVLVFQGLQGGVRLGARALCRARHARGTRQARRARRHSWTPGPLIARVRRQFRASLAGHS